VTIKLDDLEEEAVEVNRRYNNYETLRLQHRVNVLRLLGETSDPEDLKRLVQILMTTTKGGE